jgi:phytoene/squalene synthetase
MKALYDNVSIKMSKTITRAYSTSFSLGIFFLSKKFHNPIYAIYGFVRIADEIVDTFHDFNKNELLQRFWKDTYQAIDEGISLNPVLNSFQAVVREYNIDKELIDTFLRSMEMDLTEKAYDQNGYEEYILGSAEVVGLMCLKVFVEGDQEKYEKLKPYAMKLGSAFQKINFLRDLHADYEAMGRTYFPGVDMNEFSEEIKQQIEADIAVDFDLGLQGIMKLPSSSRFGVYVAYVYFYALLRKIQNTPSTRILHERIRIKNRNKIALLLRSYVRYSFNAL